MWEFLTFVGVVLLILRCFGIIGKCKMCCKKRRHDDGCCDDDSTPTKLKGDHSS